jgi:hypothetical protein
MLLMFLYVYAGCILMLTLQGQPAESDPYRLTKMIKEALGPDKIRFVEQQRQQAQTPAGAAGTEQQPQDELAQDTQQETELQLGTEGQQEQQQQAAESRQVRGCCVSC